MIDDDDVALTAIAWPSGGCLWTVLGVVVVIILAVVALENEGECARRTCPNGATPRVMAHECVCVTLPSGGQ